VARQVPLSFRPPVAREMQGERDLLAAQLQFATTLQADLDAGESSGKVVTVLARNPMRLVA